MPVRSRKATHGQLRRDNRQLLLRAVYSRLANSRADLAHETGLAKPTVSDLIGELITEGYLVETGLGQSTDEGGKRPRLLEFVPGARHVIGVSLTGSKLLGVLANLDGQVLVEHHHSTTDAQGEQVVARLTEVINGLLAQLSAPLLCIGVGVPGLVETRAGMIRYAPHLGWQNLPLADLLAQQYRVPTYVANSTELVAMAQYAFGETNNASNLVTVNIDDSVGIGIVLDGAIYHSGGEIGYLHIPPHGTADLLENRLGWQQISQRAAGIRERIMRNAAPYEKFAYLYLRRAIAEGDADALALQNELAGTLAQIFAWVIALLRPNHISLAGSISDLGQPLLDCVIEHTTILIAPAPMHVTFSLDNSSNLAALGAVAYTLQQELGLI